VLGGLAIANGSFMLFSPDGWYFAVPAVTTTGPYTQHFLRHIGLIFLFPGAALLLGAAAARHWVLAWSSLTIWLAAHAVFHRREVAAAIYGPLALSRDFPAVTLPAVSGILITWWATAETPALSLQPAQEFSR
jgi:hypothetical protein